MSSLEFEFCAPCDDPCLSKFRCKVCDTAFSKRSASAHLVNIHSLLADEVAGFIAVKDGRALNNGRPWNCMLEACYQRKLAEEILGGEVEGHIGDPAGGPGQAPVAQPPQNAVVPIPTLNLPVTYSPGDSGAASSSAPLTGGHGTLDKYMKPEMSPHLLECSSEPPSLVASPRSPRELPLDATEPRLVPELSSADNVMAVNIAATKPCTKTNGADTAKAARTAASSSNSEFLDIAKQLQDLRAMLAQQATQSLTTALEIEEPTVLISREAADFKASQLRGDKRRQQWPIQTQVDNVPTENFKRFLKGKDEDTIKMTIQGWKYFISLLEVKTDEPLGDAYYIGILAAMYRHDIFLALLQSDLLAPEHSWTRKIISAVKHYAAFAVSVCNKNNWKEASRRIAALNADILTPHTTILSKARRASNAAKNRYDQERLSNFASVDAMKKAVGEAFVDLYVIHRQFQKQDAMPPNVRFAVNVILAGILYLNGFAGRSGEWQIMLLSHVVDQLGKGIDYLVCPNHKTASTYGELAKYIAPGTVEALKLVIKLPNRGTKKLFEPAKAETELVYIAGALKKFGKVYLPDYQAPGVNLMRKFFHTELMKHGAQDKALEIISQIDAHSKGVAERTYVCKSIQEDATKAKFLVQTMLDGAAEWPSKNVLATSQRTFEEVMKKFARTTNNDDDDDDDDSDASSVNIAEDDNKSTVANAGTPHTNNVESRKEARQPEQDEGGRAVTWNVSCDWNELSY